MSKNISKPVGHITNALVEVAKGNLALEPIQSRILSIFLRYNITTINSVEFIVTKIMTIMKIVMTF